MERGTGQLLRFNNISDLLQRLALPAPQHPLIALINYNNTALNLDDAGNRFSLDFYKISFKTSFKGMISYGPGRYDFREGGLAYLAPKQEVEMPGNKDQYEGYVLYFHPDLLRGYPVATRIQHFGFFSYTVSEALYLADTEKRAIVRLFEAISEELSHSIDSFSQDILVSQIELLLQHSNRFYHRQFLTRKPIHHDLIDKMHNFFSHHFNQDKAQASGLPSPQEAAQHLGVSPRYLSDMLKALTGQTTRQHIHLLLIEKAKELLAGSELTTAGIAYQLGFEHPQSFNKLFKQKTNMSPAQFRDTLHS